MLTLTSCNRDRDEFDHICERLMTLEEANNAMEACTNNLLDSKSEIENNLIGEWALIGIVPGWFSYEPIEECIVLEIMSDSIVRKNLDTDEVLGTRWQIDAFEVNGYRGFALLTEQEAWISGMGMHEFSDTLMFGSGRAIDADTYIYKKL